MLDVLLHRNGTTRHWTIGAKSGRWICRYTDANTINVSGCATLDLALSKKAEWEAEIAAARADGWA